MHARVGSGRDNIRELSRPASLSRATADVIARLQHPNILGLMTGFPAGTITECQTDRRVEFSAQKICVSDRRVDEF
jgi:hypothetical protein